MPDRNATRSTRLPDGLEERYEKYRDERDMTESEAMRALIRNGLEAEERESVADLSPVHDALTQLAGLLAALTIAVGFGGVAGALPLGTAVLWGGGMLAAALMLLAVVAAGLTEPVDERLRDRRVPDSVAEVSD